MVFEHAFSVAPMMDWTDRHCRYFHRLLSKKAVLYTEMVTMPAIIHGDLDKLLGYNTPEHPVVLQVGGSDPIQAKQAILKAEPYGYDAYNLNVGCPSNRVQAGRFGACLMQEADLVAKIVEAMQSATQKEITIKCRLGVDDQIYQETLPLFLQTMRQAGVRHVIIHARKAWLQGLSPKDNRTIPALDYDFVYQMKQDFPSLKISINGGIDTLEATQKHLKQVDGVMMGRMAYHQPDILLDIDSKIYQEHMSATEMQSVIEKMVLYSEEKIKQGISLNKIARHMLGIHTGQEGARTWRRLLTEGMVQKDASADLLLKVYHQAFC